MKIESSIPRHRGVSTLMAVSGSPAFSGGNLLVTSTVALAAAGVAGLFKGNAKACRRTALITFAAAFFMPKFA